MSPTEFWLAFGIFAFSGACLLLALCAVAKRADEKVREFMAERERQSDPLERMWDLPSRKPVQR
jgi:hypothetical protein